MQEVVLKAPYECHEYSNKDFFKAFPVMLIYSLVEDDVATFSYSPWSESSSSIPGTRL